MSRGHERGADAAQRRRTCERPNEESAWNNDMNEVAERMSPKTETRIATPNKRRYLGHTQPNVSPLGHIHPNGDPEGHLHLNVDPEAIST